jgi:hypothetical protein
MKELTDESKRYQPLWEKQFPDILNGRPIYRLDRDTFFFVFPIERLGG